jgi:hypothetical protein
MAEDKSKDTIYVDVDDDITAIIEKMHGSKHKIAALVLPKRANALQSIVNMKLLKRKAKEANKSIVLITSESSILPLAGAVGLHVAKTLQSKPVVPPPPEVPKKHESVVDDGKDNDEVDKNKSIGELAGAAAVGAAAKSGSLEDTIDVDDIDDDKSKSGKKGKGKKSGSKIKVPNFDKFRTRMFLIAGGAVLLIILLVFANVILPKAKITIKTDAVSVSTSFNFTADTNAKTFDEAKSVVPATAKNTTVTNTQKTTATGKKNVGEKAEGTVKMSTTTNCVTPVADVPSGTAVSAGGLRFNTGEAASFNVTNVQGGKCIWTSNSVPVTAQNGGANYNLAPQSYSVAGYGGVTAQGSQMSGGTDKNITVVQQSDLDSAIEKITQDDNKAKEELTKELEEEKLFPIDASTVASAPKITTSAKVGEEASEVTVNGEVTFTMLGVKRDDLKKLVEASAKSQIDTSKQKISDDGLEEATFAVAKHDSPTTQTISVQTNAYAGAKIDEEALKEQVKGKKKGDVEKLVQGTPSVEGVTVKFSPFWVNKVPKSTKKITIVIEKPEATDSNDSSSN